MTKLKGGLNGTGHFSMCSNVSRELDVLIFFDQLTNMFRKN